MAQARLKAAFYRGGTSKAVLFNGADLPADKAIRDRIFLHVLGSPDAYGRQLDGMGGGISSLSKVVIVEPSERSDADVDYTFVQIAVDQPVADYGAMCGNMSSAVGAFAVDEGMVAGLENSATVRVHNTNTGKIFHAIYPTENGKVVEEGDFEIPGVSGRGARVQLDFLDPGGASTGKLLPTDYAIENLEVDGEGRFEVSMIDASNPMIFLKAEAVGCSAMEAPADLDANADLMMRLDRIRRTAAVAMGMASAPDAAKLSNPRIAIVAKPAEFSALDGRSYGSSDYDIAVRMVSMGNFHRAITLTGAMCVAVAAAVPGSLVNQIVTEDGGFTIGNPSGLLPVQADVRSENGKIFARSATAFRTQRRIMEGYVLFPARFLEDA